MPGTPTPLSTVTDGEVRKALNNLGDSNFQSFALGLGDARNGSKVGPLRAVWCEVALPAASGEVQISHALGRVPDFVTLVDVRVTEGQEGSDIAVVARAARQKSWTNSTVKVWASSQGAASMGGAIGVFIVGCR